MLMIFELAMKWVKSAVRANVFFLQGVKMHDQCLTATCVCVASQHCIFCAECKDDSGVVERSLQAVSAWRVDAALECRAVAREARLYAAMNFEFQKLIS